MSLLLIGSLMSITVLLSVEGGPDRTALFTCGGCGQTRAAVPAEGHAVLAAVASTFIAAHAGCAGPPAVLRDDRGMAAQG